MDPLPVHSKIISYETLSQWRQGLPASSRPLVVTNGCFDLLHVGHVFLFEEARRRGQSLLIGLNCDRAVRALKGKDRPVVPEADRAHLLAALEAVSAVCLFPQVDAVEFLKVAKPDLYVKGGDYTLESINQRELQTLREMGIPIEILPKIQGRSTSTILKGISGRLPES